MLDPASVSRAIDRLSAAALGSGREFGLFGIRVEFLLFGLTLLGVALFHRRALLIAASGLAALIVVRSAFTDFDLLAHLFGGGSAVDGVPRAGEWRLLLNLLGLLLGFALLAKQFEESRLPDLLPKLLPDGALGSACLLALVFLLSAFLDNIAAAMIGGTLARAVHRDRVHVGYLAAIVAAANAGGAGSVLGDTTTTMMWIEGAEWTQVLRAFVAAGAALAVVAVCASRQQHRWMPIARESPAGIALDKGRLLAVAAMLAGAIATNVWLEFPALGLWLAIAIGAPLRSMAWRELAPAFKGALFLLSLVLCASLMPVDELPAPSWKSTLGLGFVSSVFDNIPLTKLALDQGGYDWALLAYAVGFGGSMTWFGSSAGVALSSAHPEARDLRAWIKCGWHVPVAYLVGFAVLYFLLGWNPQDLHRG